MLYSLIITIFSIICIIILMLVYFTKKNFNRIQNKIYKYFFIVTLTFLIFQVISVFSLNYTNNDFLVFITWRISWSGCIAWYGLFYFYFSSSITKDDSKNIFEYIKKDKLNLILSIIFVLGLIGYFTLLPFAGLDPQNMTYIPGSTSYIVWVFCFFINSLVIIKLIKNKDKVSKKNKFVIWMSILATIIIMGIQILYQYISIVPLGFTILMYFLYFSLEDPDLILLEETKIIKDEIEKLNQVKVDFLSNISYEIKNPMDSICSITDTLLNTQITESTARNYLRELCDSGSDLLDIINNILDLSAIESGSDLLKFRNYNTKESIIRLVNATKNKLGYSKVQFNVNLDKNISSVLYGDESKIYQCVLNVLINAIKYTDVGKINLTISSKKEGPKETLLFKVEDTGIGIKEEDANKLFEKFTRLDDAVSKEIEGTGLGLTIAQKYLNLMEGKIWFESQYLAGSTFYIEVPQTIVDATPINNVVLDNKSFLEKEPLDCSKYNILIVDDNKLNSNLMIRLLERYHFNIDCVSSGDECITKIKSGEDYNMILMDDSMPEISGSETLKVIKELLGNDLPPVIVLTANAIFGMKEAYINLGFSDYISKPIDISELDRIINKYLNKMI